MNSNAPIVEAIHRWEQGTLRDVLCFATPDTTEEAAHRISHSIELVLDEVADSLQSVHATMERFGRAPIEIALGAGAPRVLKAYDAFVKLVGKENLVPHRVES